MNINLLEFSARESGAVHVKKIFLKIHNDTAMILYPLYSAADEADHSPGGIRGRSARRTGERKRLRSSMRVTWARARTWPRKQA